MLITNNVIVEWYRYGAVQTFIKQSEANFSLN